MRQRGRYQSDREKERRRKAPTVWKREACGGVEEERELLVISHGESVALHLEWTFGGKENLSSGTARSKAKQWAESSSNKLIIDIMGLWAVF